MFNLARNSSTVIYKQYQGRTEIIDANGNKTGSWTPQYGDFQTAQMFVSPNKGEAESEMFGSVEPYDRVMITADINCPIDEESVLWLDGASTDKPYNFIVTKRAPWRNSIAYAIKKVQVSD